MIRLVTILPILAVSLASFGVSSIAPQGETSAAYDRFVREFLGWYYAEDPVRATALGIHEHDHRLPDLSRPAIERRVAELRGWLERLERINRYSLADDAFYDHRILEYAIRAQLLELEEVRSWRKSPHVYNAAIASGLATLSSREFAPLAVRLDSLIARSSQIPVLLAAARENLQEVPLLWVEEALRDARGLLNFLEDDLPETLDAQGFDSVDLARRRRWSEGHADAIREIEAFSVWLERDLLPRANGDFRLGKDLFERKLLYEEHIDMSAEQLRDMNERAIEYYQAWVQREAGRIDSDRPASAVMDLIARDHPPARELIPTARRMVEEVRDLVLARQIVTLPSNERPIVRESPPYARRGFAFMDTPGPFETGSLEAFFNITNIDPDWTAEQQAQHLTYFSYPGLLGIAVHEAFPGHFVQLLYQPQIPTDVRKVFTTGSSVEGWAHYVEQMMVDEGLAGREPAVRLGQLRRALQRHARWHAGLAMHVFGESIDDAARRFEEIAYFAPFPARREVERGASEPTYLYYALGRMQIFELREEYRRYRRSRGETFTLRDFHDTFLRLGLPIPLAREAMLSRPEGSS